MSDLINDVNAFLHSQIMLEQIRISGYGECIMTDSWVQDFSKAWGSEKNSDPPKWLEEETNAYLKAQKDAATVTPISPSCYIVADSEANRVQIWTGRGTAEILKSDIPALLAALSLMAAPTTGVTPGWAGPASNYVPPKQALMQSGPQQMLQKRNDESMEYAIEQANKRYYRR